jgi:hypothetical protein
VQLTPSSSSSSSTAAPVASRLSAAMPSRFCGVHVSTDGGSVSVGQVQEADMQLVTRGGTVAVKRCKANSAAINTAAEPQQAGQGGSMQVRMPWSSVGAGSRRGDFCIGPANCSCCISAFDNDSESCNNTRCRHSPQLLGYGSWTLPFAMQVQWCGVGTTAMHSRCSCLLLAAVGHCLLHPLLRTLCLQLRPFLTNRLAS